MIQIALFHVWRGDAQIEFSASSIQLRTVDHLRKHLGKEKYLFVWNSIPSRGSQLRRSFRTQQNEDTIKTSKNDQAGHINIY